MGNLRSKRLRAGHCEGRVNPNNARIENIGVVTVHNMNFIDFLLKFWWIELMAAGAIAYGWYTGYFQTGTALLLCIASLLLFGMLSQSGLE